MDELREILMALIKEGTGQRHLMRMAAEGSAIVVPRQRAISATLSTERLPFDQLTAQQATLEQQLNRLDALSAKMTEHLGGLLKTRVRLAVQPFKGFSAYLHYQLDEEIKSTNLRNDKECNKLEVHKSKETYAWLTGPDGPATVWEGQFESFEQATLNYVRSELDMRDTNYSIGKPPPLDVRQLTASGITRRKAPMGSTLEKTALFVTAATPISAGATWALGVALSAVLWPATIVTAAGVVTFATLTAIRKSRSALEVERRELIQDIDNEASKIQRSVTEAFEAQGELVIANALDYLDNYRRELEQLLENIRRRVAEPETVERLELIRKIEPLEYTANELVSSLSQLTDH